jgi:hypothetical protein
VIAVVGRSPWPKLKYKIRHDILNFFFANPLFWTTVRPLFKRSLQAKDVAQIDARLSTVGKDCQKSLLQLTIFSTPDRALNRETSENQGVETVCLDASQKVFFATSEITSC